LRKNYSLRSRFQIEVHVIKLSNKSVKSFIVYLKLNLDRKEPGFLALSYAVKFIEIKEDAFTLAKSNCNTQLLN
jgi:hypothetical protein